MNTRLLLIAALTLPACTDAEPTTEGDGEIRSVIMDSVSFVRRYEDGTTWGFNVDGLDSTPGDSDGCNKADFPDPEGRTGIDSAFSGMLPALDATEASAIEPLVLDSIAAGRLLLIVEVSGIDSWPDDECVELGIYRGTGLPMIGTDGALLDGQTFALHPEIGPTIVECAELIDGTVWAFPFDMDLPMQVLDVEMEFHMRDGGLRVDVAEDGTAWGYFGGGVPTEDILRIVEEDDLADIRPLVTDLVNLSADLEPLGDGTCGSMSTIFEFTGTPAYRYTE